MVVAFNSCFIRCAPIICITVRSWARDLWRSVLYSDAVCVSCSLSHHSSALSLLFSIFFFLSISLSHTHALTQSVSMLLFADVFTKKKKYCSTGAMFLAHYSRQCLLIVGSTRASCITFRPCAHLCWQCTCQFLQQHQKKK